MGRFSYKASPLTAQTLVLMPINETTTGGISASGGYYQNGIEYVQTGSITSTATLLSVDGPGVLRYADVGPYTTTGPARVQVWLDEVLVYDQSVDFTTSLLLNMVGATIGAATLGAYRSYLCDNIPFKASARIMLASQPTGGSYIFGYSYRLTQ